MKSTIVSFCVAMAMLGASAAPVKVIFDTDMLTDFDDVGALASLHALADAGECEILATVSCTRGNASVGAVQIINTYYGRRNLPVGCAKGMGVSGARADRQVKVDPAAPLGERQGGDGGHYKYRKLLVDYPGWYDYANSDDAPDANVVYRKALAAAPDNSVVICSVGFLTNLRRLLETKADDISPLAGKALVAKKVKRWVAMACKYPRGKEYNSRWDWKSSRIVLENWPTPVVFTDWDYGADLFAGREIAEMGGPRNPVKDVFAGNIPSREEVRADPVGWSKKCFGMGGRAAWDETAVLLAVRGESRYFNVQRGTYRMVGKEGENEWIPDAERGRHLRITEKMPKQEVGKVIDELICRRPKAQPVNIDGGRQLFIDDLLIASSDGVVRHWNEPIKAISPVLRPTADDGTREGSSAVATDGGLWWDPTRRKYRLWYEDDWAGQLCYAESDDGIRWTKPDLGVVPGTNRVLDNAANPRNQSLDSWSVWPDYAAKNPYGAWKLMVSAPGALTTDTLYASPDGISFARLGIAGYSGDRTTMHYDTLLGKWVFSLRDCRKPYGRCRRFWTQRECVPPPIPYSFDYNRERQLANTVAPEIWSSLDEVDYGPNGSLYNFDAAPYESLMLGVLEVLHNTPRDNCDSEDAGLPKQTSLRFAFSRDGRRYRAAPNSAIRPSGWGSGKWDTGYLSAIGGICCVSEDELRFYYSALRGDAELSTLKIGQGKPMCQQGIYCNGAIGYATLRRDGFAGMVADGKGELVTPLLAFTGSRLFVNAECLYGEVAAELLDAELKPIAGFTAEDCHVMKFTDSSKRELAFKGGELSQFVGKPVAIRFKLHCATLYSFWVSPSERGESRGYVAAGGPQYPGLRDER